MANFLMVKVCVLGVSTVGKTSIASRYVQDTFNSNSSPTLGAAFLSRYCSAPCGTVYKFQIWDTAGQERYKTLAPLYYRGASVILIVYDISNRDSFVNGASDWVAELRGKGLDDAQWVLIGNKLDLALKQREVQEHEGLEFAEKIGALFYETSAKTGRNVNNIFSDIAARLEKSDTPAAKKAVIQIQETELKRRGTVKMQTEAKDEAVGHSHKIWKKCCPS